MPAGSQFVLILPDGSKSLIPADWTDFNNTSDASQALELVGSLDDLRAARAARLAGACVGRALYDGKFTIGEALACLS